MAGTSAYAAPALAQAADRCAALEGKAFPAQTMMLPTQGAVVTSAKMEGEGEGRYCQVKGKIAPVDPAAPPVLYAVDLPERWNGKAAQLGGGGLNGTLVNGTGGAPNAPAGVTPLARGFATFGTDAGHGMTPTPTAFALNREALINHAYGAYKKSHDVAEAIIEGYYGRKPTRTYFLGASEGGREALIVTQRYPKDYDGVVAVVPLISFVGMQVAKMGAYQEFGKNGFSKAQIGLVRDATMSSCDGKDGSADGVVSTYLECRVNFTPVRCKPGQDPKSCLSGDQIRWFERVHAPYRLPYTLNNGLRLYPSFGYGGELTPRGGLDAMLNGELPEMTMSVLRDFALDGKGDPLAFDPIKSQDRIKELSGWLDATDSDLSPFAARGGKLIMAASGADYIVSPYHAMLYYQSVVQRMGQKRADEFLRLYVAPGMGHYRDGTQGDGTPLPDKTDYLAALDAWVEQGTAPGDLVMTSYAKNGAALASRPLCRFPSYPKLIAGRDRTKADSYVCTAQSTALLKQGGVRGLILTAMSKALAPPVMLGTIAAQLRLNLPQAGDGAALSNDLIEAVLESAARFAGEQLAPLNATGDADPPRLSEGKVGMSPLHRQAWNDHAAAGWLSLDMDPRWGGQGLPVLLAVAVQEIFDRACPAFGMLAVPIRSAARLLQAYAPAEVQGDWLPALAAGTSGATICISEVDAGSDVMRLRTHARHDGTGWRISGEKQWISFGDHDLTDRIGHCLLARTEGRRGLSLFLVPASRASDTNGVTVRRLEEKLGLHLSPTCALGFEESAGILLGEEERGLAQMFVMIANMRLSVGAMGLGIASAAADTARLYAGERRQGGRDGAATPIREHPDVQRQLLRPAADIEVLRGLLYATAAYADRSRNAADADERADAAALLELLLPLVKTLGGETGFAVASEAIQTLGGAGYTQAWPVEQCLRDARVLTIFEGTTGIQALDVLHRRLWRDEGRGLTPLVALCEAESEALPGEGAVDLRRMLAALAEARDWLVAHRAEPRVAEASATAFLDLVGLVARGWQAARLANLPGDHPAHVTLRALGAYWLRGRGIQAEALAVEIGNGGHLLDAFAAAGL